MKRKVNRKWWALLGLVALTVVIVAPFLYAAARADRPRNFRVVEDGVLYRSGQLTPVAFAQVLDDHHIKTVITLRTTRDAARPYPDEWERIACEARGLKHIRIIPRRWVADESGEIPASHAVREFLAVMDDPANYPVLVHCFAGIHRTGAMCAVFRMEYQKWTPDEAVGEMHSCGFEPGGGREYIEDYLRATTFRAALVGGARLPCRRNREVRTANS